MTTSVVPMAGHPAATIAEIMSRPVLTVEIDESLWDAWQLLFVSGLRHLVVTNEDSACLGTLSDRNILADVPSTIEHLSNRRVRDIISRVPSVTVRPDDHPQFAAQLMRDHAVEAVPVLDDSGRLLGIVTETDLVRWAADTA
jgi:acetoin utilization protein AcuB